VRLVLTRKGRIACPRRQRSCQTGNTAQVLTLGRGTACLLLPDSAVRAAYRIRRRHGLVCAEPRGRLLRALMAPGGQVDCEDSVDLDANGQPLPGGPACAPATDPSGTVPTPVNLTGRWQVEAYPYTCQLTAEQNGDELSLDITCPGVIGLQAEGVVTFADHRLTSTGTVSGFPCGAPATLDAVVSPDGNHAQGTVGCGGIQLAFTSDRRLDDTPTP
jgi:hypothetical protein